MNVAGFDAQYVGHVCFIFTSPGAAAIVTDPFFAEGFTWKGRTEKYLSRPDISIDDITTCDAVFVSHIHGDHYDPAAVKAIVKNTGAQVWAPGDTVEDFLQVCPDAQAIELEEGIELELGDVTATMYAGYDNSFDEQGRPNKFSLLMEAGGKRIFYSGDCHDAPPAMVGRTVDALFSWPHPNDEKLVGLCDAIDAKQYVLMHGDRFDPGDFFCNFSYEEQKRRVNRLVPDVEVVIPERVRRVRQR